MFSEASSFTPTSANTTVVLNDTALVVKAIWFQYQKVSGSQSAESTGFTDGVNNYSKWSVVTSSKREGGLSSANALYFREDVSGTTTDKVIGGCTTGAFATPGEFIFTASQYVAVSVQFIAMGTH